MKKIIYLCGPITGTSIAEASSWRNVVKERLGPKFVCLDPTRDNPDFVKRSNEPYTLEEQVRRFNNGKAVITRDRMDLYACDLVLANFLSCKNVSIGSIGEIFWADAYQKPVIAVREESGNIHDHDMINAIVSWTFQDIQSAINKINILFP